MMAGVLELPRQAADLERVASNGRASTSQLVMDRQGAGWLQPEQQVQTPDIDVAGEEPACKCLSMLCMLG